MSHTAHNHAHDGHNHDHAHPSRGLRALLIVLGFTTIIFLAELIGGLWSQSLALLSDAMHMLSDSTGLIVAVIAIIIGKRKATPVATYGYRRIEVIAALINAAAVSAISVWIVIEALSRLHSHEEVNTTMMLIIGTIGLIANIFGALVLHNHAEENINIQGAFLHVLVDLFGSVAVILAAIIMQFTGFSGADTIASLIIAVLILPRSISLLSRAYKILMEHAPANIDVDKLAQELRAVPTVQAIHDLHVWSVNGEEALATCHVVIDTDNSSNCTVLDKVQQVFSEHGIEHSTVQIESHAHYAHEEVCH
ncbi:cation transporter [Corynebacterium sp. sy017]|uniref:cation diffusion facilitator family transporter n=1 Tax=unclassified Corynebacterium TaxID=2624378 RepID=UPI001185DFA5|nr:MULTISPECIES: cation diffusion facilitator family transporter [unclassified Corynebacterium]MBP3089060.1 cation transporter [Corynebacterium sp. sy017]TSD91377.1 cation transporter [Corynebacterium sp. SY003]